jgi:hypothetical protein
MELLIVLPNLFDVPTRGSQTEKKHRKIFVFIKNFSSSFFKPEIIVLIELLS